MEKGQKERTLFRKTEFRIFLYGTILSGAASIALYLAGRSSWTIPAFLIWAVFLSGALWLGCSYIEMDEEEICFVQFGKCRRKIRWSEVQEVVLVGIYLFGESRNNPKIRYIYFSKDSLNKEERYDLYRRWPPKKQLYCQYQEDFLEQVETNWHGQVTYYNFA